MAKDSDATNFQSLESIPKSIQLNDVVASPAQRLFIARSSLSHRCLVMAQERLSSSDTRGEEDLQDDMASIAQKDPLPPHIGQG